MFSCQFGLLWKHKVHEPLVKKAEKNDGSPK